VTSIAVGGTTVVLGSADGSVKIWRTSGESPAYGVPFLEGNGVVVDALAFTTTRTVLGADRSGLLSEWRLDDSEALPSTTIGDAALSVVAVSPNDELAAVASSAVPSQPEIHIVDRQSRAVGEPLTTLLWGVTSMAFADDHALFTAGHHYGQPMIERRSTDDPSTVIDKWRDQRLSAQVKAFAVAPDLTKLVAAGDGFVAVFDPNALSTATVVTEVPGHDAIGILLLAGNALFVTVGKEGTLRTWSANTGEALGTLSIPEPVGVGIDARGERMFTAGPDGNLRAFGCVAAAS
jgi:WD40 repeat protein